MTTIGVADDAAGLRLVAPQSDLVVVAGSEAIAAAAATELAWTAAYRYQELAFAERVLDVCDAVARAWRRTPEAAVLDGTARQEGVQVAALLELPLYHVTAVAALALLQAEQLVEAERPERVVVAPNPARPAGLWIGFTTTLLGEAVREVAGARGIEVVDVPRAAPPVDRGRALHAELAARQWFRPRSIPARVDVLVYAEGRHGTPLLPLVGAMHERGLAVGYLEDGADPAVAEAMIGRGAELVTPERGAVARGGVELHPEALPEVSGVPLAALMGWQLKWLASDGAADARRRLAAAAATLDSVRPRALVSAIDTSLTDLAWVLTAKARGIPTLTPLHGGRFTRPDPRVWAMPQSSVSLAWGPLSAEWLKTACGAEPRAIEVGAPHLEAARARIAAKDRDGGRARLGVGPGDTLVLFLVAMTGGHEAPFFGDPADIYAAYFDAVEEIGGVPIVRTHPVSDPAVAARVAAERGLAVHVNPPIDLAETLAAADLVVTQPTTAALEAMEADLPVVFLTRATSPGILWWLERSELERAASSAELAASLERLRADGAERDRALAIQRSFLDALVGPRDGRSAERAAEAVAAALEGS